MTAPDRIPSTPMSVLPDPQLRELVESLHRNGHPAFHAAGAQNARDALTKMKSTNAYKVEMAVVEDLTVGDVTRAVRVRTYRPFGEDAKGVIIYMHGGGWVVGGLDESDHLCRAIAHRTGLELVSVDYRLAPEHPFPAAVDDVDTVLNWVTEEHRPGVPVVMMGDSAGGNLATVAARRFRDLGRPDIAFQVLVYPVTDHRMNTTSYRERGQRLLISSRDMKWFWDQYVPDHEVRTSPDASPLDATDLSGLPPALVIVAEFDPLRDEVVQYARRLSEAGVAVTVDRYSTMAHGFFPLIESVDMARAAVDSVASAIRQALDP